MALNASGRPETRSSLFASPYFIVYLAGSLVMLPALLFGALRYGIDSIFHARWMHHFSAQFWSGEVYPRWLMDMNDGFGSPAFFIYPPLSQYVTALLHPLFPDSRAAALLGVSAWLAITISGLACLCWLRRALPGHGMAALSGALIYMLAPYHLYIDVYQRGALAEVWAFVWPPLSLLLVHRLDRFRPEKLALLALSVAGLLITHAPSSLILVPAYFLYAAVLDWREKRFSRILWLTVACALACLLAGWYLGTALTHAGYVDTGALFSGRNASGNWLIGGGTWPDPAIQRDVCISVALQGTVGLAASATAFLKAKRGEATLPLAALLLLVIPLFMMSILSKPIWDLGLPLNKVQFPWRFSLLLSLACALAVALVSVKIPSRRWLMATPVLFLAANILLYILPSTHLLPVAAVRPANPVADSWDAPEYWPARESEIHGVFAAGEKARLLGGTGTLHIAEWRPRSLRIEADTSTASVIAVRQFTYPGWTLIAPNPRTGFALNQDGPHLVVEVPPGKHLLHVVLAESPAERAGRLASILAGLVTAGLLLWGWVRSREPG